MYARRATWSPDGLRVAFWTGEPSKHTLRVTDLASEARTRIASVQPAPQPAATIDGLTFSPDGRWLAYVYGCRCT